MEMEHPLDCYDSYYPVLFIVFPSSRFFSKAAQVSGRRRKQGSSDSKNKAVHLDLYFTSDGNALVHGRETYSMVIKHLSPSTFGTEVFDLKGKREHFCSPS
jgi:hypothetical protein